MCRDAIYRVRQLFWKAESFVGSAFLLWIMMNLIVKLI